MHSYFRNCREPTVTEGHMHHVLSLCQALAHCNKKTMGTCCHETHFADEKKRYKNVQKFVQSHSER